MPLAVARKGQTDTPQGSVCNILQGDLQGPTGILKHSLALCAFRTRGQSTSEEVKKRKKEHI